MRQLLLSLFFFSLLISCENKKKTNDKHIIINNKKENKKNDSVPHRVYDEIVLEYDNNESLLEGNSLTYAERDIEKDVTIFLDQSSNKKVKMVYTIKNTSSLYKEIFTFYFLNEKKICSKKLTSSTDSIATYLTETISYYDSTGVFLSRKKSGIIDNFNRSNLKTCKKQSHSLKEAEDILVQTGKYETRFKSILKNEKDYYLIVGENKKNGVHAVLNVINPNADFLNLDKKKNIGKKLTLQFDKTKNEDDWFQKLNSFEFEKK
ncbi:MAG: hypothetical protein P8I93_09195 [Crocinitomicaceae bacterium]|nr:hypothetical protein [Crocinitomicaceae bacterium]